MDTRSQTDFRLSLPITLALFFSALGVMEAAALFAVTRAGDPWILLFLQPACFFTALCVGVWLGAMASAGEIRRTQPSNASLERRRAPAPTLVAQAGASA